VLRPLLALALLGLAHASTAEAACLKDAKGEVICEPASWQLCERMPAGR
jgi:hypothetical protein